MLPPRPLLGVWGCLYYPTLISAGWGWCLGRGLSFAPCSRWCLLSGCASLRLRVLGGSWFAPLCSPDCRSASRFTYPALPPVSRLSFRLGDFSFGCGFGLFLSVLLAPWGCWCACCYPPRGCESARVLPSLLVPSPSGVCHFFSSLFLCWRPCRNRSLIPSLAPSWWRPCPLLRWALLTLSGYVLSVPSAISLHRYHSSIPSHC